MARTEARIRTRIWGDSDFRALSMGAQWTYQFLLSQSDLSHAGVLPLRVRRWAGHAVGVTAEVLEQTIAELERARFVVTDRNTEELLVRTFIRNDEIYRQPNLLRAAHKALGEVTSVAILRALAVEVRRCMDLAEGAAKTILEAMARDLPEPIADGFAEPIQQPIAEPPRGQGSVTTVATATPIPIPLTPDSTTPPGASRRARVRTSDSDDFAAFWSAYPRRTAKDAARKAWTGAIKRAEPECIIAAARRFAADPNRVDQFTPHPATWLNQGRWDDDPLPARDQTAGGLTDRNRANLALVERMAALDAHNTQTALAIGGQP